MKIGDLYWALRADGAQLEPDMTKAAQQAGDKAGKTLGDRMSLSLGSALKAGLRAGLGAVAAGSALALKGLTELSTIQADFQAATGATADEANRAGQAINEMAGRNLQPLREIGDALTVVHTDLGLTGDAAEKTTEKFLKYATATKQNAAAAVKDFDDVLDAWGLTADHAGEVMDKLIVSHQKYGGSIEQNQKDLANLAPQLKGLNLSIDDGIGLLNLFAASGLDASKAQFALNSAIQKLPPGTSLNDIIAKLSAIEDPAKRADEAIKVFGARGGAALANVLRPGIRSLGDFEISATDAAGATEKAADAIESAFPNQVALRIKAIGSAILGVGQSLGPLVTTLAGLASLGGALGLDKLLGSAWKAAAGSGVVKSAIAFASDQAATLYLKALFAGDALSGVLSKVWAAIPGSAAVGAAIKAAAGRAAALFTTEILGSFAAAPLLVPLALVLYVVGSIAGDKESANELVYKKLKEQGVIGGKAAGEATAKAQNDAWVSSSAEFANRQGKQAATAVVEKYGDAMIAAGKKVGSDFSAQMLSHFAEVNKLGPALAANAKRLANLAGLNVAQGIRQKRDTVDQAWNDMLDGLKEATSVTGRTSHLLGRLVSKKLQDGLHSGDPATRAQARGTKQLILDELAQLKPRAGTLSKQSMDFLRKGMKSKDADIKQAATDIYNAAVHGKNNQGPASLPASGTTYGKNFIGNVIAGMNSQQKALALASAGLAGIARDHFQLSSPAKLGPWSKKGGPEGWGKRFTEFLLRGITADLPSVQSTIDSALAMPRQLSLPDIGSVLGGSITTPALAATNGLTVAAGPSVTIGQLHLHDIGSDVSPQRAAKFGREVMREVASGFRHDGARNGIHPERP